MKTSFAWKQTVYLAALVVISVLMGFQNCGSPVTETSSGIEVSSDSTMALLNSKADVSVGNPFSVAVDANAFPRYTEYLWSHDFSDGSIFCDQTTTYDQITTTISCPDFGWATVSVTAVKPDGTQETHSIVIPVGVTGVAPGDIPGGPTPLPTPGPQLSAGALLYNQKCGGCHGDLPSNTNRRGRTFSQITGALANVAQMQFLSGTLSTAQIQSIVDALK